MKQLINAVFRAEGRNFLELHDAICKTANIKPGEIFSQQLTPDGILLKRMEEHP